MNAPLPAILVLADDAAFGAAMADYLALHLKHPLLRELPADTHSIGVVITEGGAALPPALPQTPWIALLNADAQAPPEAIALRLPLRLSQLLAAVRRALAQTRKAGAEMALTENCLFMAGERVVRDAEGKSVSLTEKEGQMLQLLAAHRGEWLKGEDLLKQVWGYGDAITTHTLQTHVYRLRQKIAPLCGEEIIESAPGMYRLTPHAEA